MADLGTTFLVAVVGGVAANATAFVFASIKDRLSRHKAILDRTYSDIENLIAQISKQSQLVWGAVGDPASSDTVAVVGQLHQLATFVSVITQHVETGALRLNSPLVNFRRQVSGGNFDVLNRPPEPSQFLSISASAAALTAAIRTLQLEENRIF